MFWRGALLSVLVALAVRPGKGEVYSANTVQHATTPIATIATPHATICALHCFYLEECIKFSHSSGSCQLWPQHTAENPLTAAEEALFQQRLPPGFVDSDDPNIAYLQVSGSYFYPASTNVSDLCRTHDPDALPAVPDTLAKVTYLRTHNTYSYAVVGLHRLNGVIRSAVTGEVVTLPPEVWHHQGTSEDCFTISSSGIYAQACTTGSYYYICQFTPLS